MITVKIYIQNTWNVEENNKYFLEIYGRNVNNNKRLPLLIRTKEGKTLWTLCYYASQYVKSKDTCTKGDQHDSCMHIELDM